MSVPDQLDPSLTSLSSLGVGGCKRCNDMVFETKSLLENKRDISRIPLGDLSQTYVSCTPQYAPDGPGLVLI